MVKGHILLILSIAHGLDDVYPSKPSTELGCECKDDSKCDTALLFHCNAASFCLVKSKECAHGTASWSVGHGSYYDYCTFEPYMTYESMKASEKHAIFLEKLKDGGNGQFASKTQVVFGIMGESVRQTFEASADVFPHVQADRTKWIHSTGTIGGIRFESTGNHAYTGLFKGAEYGIMRLSSAGHPDSSGVTPGMGVKLFRDGRPSANFVAMYSLSGQTCSDSNFFAHDWSNHVKLEDDIGLKLGAAKFWQASYCPTQVGVSDIASDETGAGNFPYQLGFVPAIKSDCPCTDYDKCLANLMQNLEVGKPIFEVMAKASPKADYAKIGTIYTTEAFVRSKFGDEQLFFRHQRQEEDYQIKPEWLDDIDRKDACGMSIAGTVPPKIEDGCHSPFDNAADKMLSTDIVV